MQGQYSLLPSLYHAYAVKTECKQCTQMSGRFNKPLPREDSFTLHLILLQEDFSLLPSNRVISSLEGKFGTVDDTFVLVLEPLFMKISNFV
jgi:hypothetical protein